MNIRELSQELNVNISVVRAQYRAITGVEEGVSVKSTLELPNEVETAIRLAISEQVYQQEPVPMSDEKITKPSGIRSEKSNCPPTADEFVELAVGMAHGMTSEMKFKSSVSGALMQLLSDYEAGMQSAPQGATHKEVRMAGMDALPQHDKLRAAIAALYDARLELEDSFTELRNFTSLKSVTYIPEGMAALGEVSPTGLLSGYFAEYTPTGAGVITMTALPEKSVPRLVGQS